MNDALNQRWIKALPPFDGLTVAFVSEELTPLPALRQVLLAIIPILQERWPKSKIFMLDDWHEHDGYVNAAQPTTWQEIIQRIGVDDTTMAFTHGDWGVRLAFFPEDHDFYLRVYIPSDDDNDYSERRGSFDITCVSEFASDITDLARSASSLPIAEIPAKAYFDSRYGG